MADNNTKKLTVKEFKMWLQGVEEMQAEGWTPDARQWTKIREKINEVLDDAPAQTVRRAASADTIPGFPTSFGGDMSGTSGAVPAGPSSLNTPAMPTPTSRAVTTPGGLPITVGTTPTGQPLTKTPDIDTTHGKPYKPPFV